MLEAPNHCDLNPAISAMILKTSEVLTIWIQAALLFNCSNVCYTFRNRYSIRQFTSVRRTDLTHLSASLSPFSEPSAPANANANRESAPTLSMESSTLSPPVSLPLSPALSPSIPGEFLALSPSDFHVLTREDKKEQIRHREYYSKWSKGGAYNIHSHVH